MARYLPATDALGSPVNMILHGAQSPRTFTIVKACILHCQLAKHLFTGSKFGVPHLGRPLGTVKNSTLAPLLSPSIALWDHTHLLLPGVRTTIAPVAQFPRPGI